MKVRASLGLTIDITSDREMGLEIEDSEVENYTIQNFMEYLHELIKTNDIYNVISVEIINYKEEKDNG
jgi:16S rRNA G527 N7-methylase RsmG